MPPNARACQMLLPMSSDRSLPPPAFLTEHVLSIHTAERGLHGKIRVHFFRPRRCIHTPASAATNLADCYGRWLKDCPGERGARIGAVDQRPCAKGVFWR